MLDQTGGDSPPTEMIKTLSRTMVCDMDFMRNRLSPESAASLPSHMQWLMDHVEQANGNFETDDSHSTWEGAALSYSVNAAMTMQALARYLKFGVTDAADSSRRPTHHSPETRIAFSLVAKCPLSYGRQVGKLINLPESGMLTVLWIARLSRWKVVLLRNMKLAVWNSARQRVKP
jgi:hypothetical protein